MPILWMSPSTGPLHWLQWSIFTNADGPERWRGDLGRGYGISWDLSRVEVAGFDFSMFREPEMWRFESDISEGVLSRK